MVIGVEIRQFIIARRNWKIESGLWTFFPHCSFIDFWYTRNEYVATQLRHCNFDNEIIWWEVSNLLAVNFLLDLTVFIRTFGKICLFWPAIIGDMTFLSRILASILAHIQARRLAYSLNYIYLTVPLIFQSFLIAGL